MAQTLEDIRETSKLTGKGYHDKTMPDVERESQLDTRQIVVKEGTKVNYVVSKTGYISESGEVIADDFIVDKEVVLSKLVTLTINAVPSSATVTLISAGYAQVGNTITVLEGSTVRYLVAKEGYETIDATIVVTDDLTLNITLPGHVVIENFDYMVLRYVWTNGQDLDTRTYFTNLLTLPSLNMVKVGWGTGHTSVPDSSSVLNSILYWAGDNTGTASAANPQEENILVSINNLINETYYDILPETINVDLEATWYRVYGTPPTIVEIIAYRGGTMSYSNYKFINTGGERVQFRDSTGSLHDSISIDVYNIPTTLRTYAVIGNLTFEKATKKATLSIVQQ